MLLKSDTVHNAWAATQRTVGVKLTIKGTEYDASDITSLTFDSGAMNGEALALGSTYQNTIKVVFSNLIEGLALTDEITPELGIKLPDGTWDYTPLGVFVIDAEVQQDRNNNTTTVSASDRMCMLGGTYKSKLTYPAAINDIAVEIANLAAVKLNEDDFARLPTDKVASFGKVTYRDAIGFVAQFAGGFATFDRKGLLDIRQLVDPNFDVAPSQYQSKGLTKNEALYRIGGITCTVTTTTTDDSGNETQDTTTLQSGSTAGTQITISNPGMTQDLLDGLYEQLQDLNFYPFSLSWFGDPNLEAGDWIEVQDTAGNTFKTPNLLYSLTFSGGVTATSKADTTVSASASFVYKGQLNQIVENIRQYLNASGQQVSEGLDEPPHPKAGDVWFKKSGPDTYIMMYKVDPETGIGSWVEEVSTKGVSGLDAELKAAKAKLNADILAAQANLATAQKDVAALQTKLATNDQTQAQITKDLAANAQLVTTNKADVDAALVTVNKTLTQAQTDTAAAVKNADLAVTTAQSAVNASGLATESAQAASDAALAAKNLATQVSSDFDGVRSQAATAANDAATALDQAKSALSMANGISGDYKSIKQIVDDTAGTIKTLATSASVDAVSGRVTKAQSLAEQTANGLTFKADNSVVDTLSDTVKQQGIDLKAAQGELKLKITQNDLSKGLDGYATQTWAQNQITATSKGWEEQLSSVQTSLGARNLVTDSEFLDTPNLWMISTYTGSADFKPGIDGNGSFRTFFFNYSTFSTAKWSFAKSQKVDVTAITALSASARIYTAPTDVSTGAEIQIEWYDSAGKIVSSGKTATESVAGLQGKWQTIKQENVSKPTGAVTASLVLFVRQNGRYWFSYPMMNAGTTVADYRPGVADSSQFATLKLSVDGFSTTFAKQTDLDMATAKLDVTANGLSAIASVTGEKGEKVTQVIADVKNIKTTMTGADGYTTRLQTLEGFQQTATATLSGVATTSQVTQLANQLTSSIGVRNLVADSDFSDINNTWYISTYSSSATTRNDFWQAADGGGAGHTLRFSGTNFTDAKWAYAKSRSVSAKSYTKLSASVMVWSTDLDSGAALKIEFVDSAGKMITDGANAVISDNSKVNVWQTIKTENVAVPSNAAVVHLTLFAIKNGNFSFLHPMMNVGSTALLYSASDFAQSQITQLQDAINLRVTKDGIISQINLTAGKTLIQNNSIYLDASTVTMGGTAFINAANIKSINAATITSGSISADRLATTKLNADNITSGSIAAARIATTALSATNITSGTFDASKMTVKNLSADLIASGTIDASKITVKNLSASNIIGGELDALLVNVKNLNASNIITGTLNAGLLNVIGLNASAISAGTITGANLAINLGTGEVMFQKGSIKSADGHLNIDVNNGTFVQSDGTKGMMFANGNLYLSSSSWWDKVSNPVTAPKPDYGFIGYGDTLTQVRGFEVVGRDALTLGLTDNDIDGMEYTASPVITMNRSNVTLNFSGELATIQAGKGFTIPTNPYYNLGQTPGIQIGSNVDRSGIGDRVFIDGSYVYIPSAYSRTSSGSANLIVAADGAIVRTSSATKYKSNIERFRNTDMGETLLTLPQAHWYNKQDMQRYTDDPQHYSMPELDYGMIAEDLAAAGLEDLVVRGDDGQLEDIRYDRFGPALLPLLAQMKQEIEELKSAAKSA